MDNQSLAHSVSGMPVFSCNTEEYLRVACCSYTQISPMFYIDDVVYMR